jgi:D-psicose/D-tagatose/L-ribulose 3-epimerase
MRYGCCAAMAVPEAELCGVEAAALLKSLGYDYIELSVSSLMSLSGGQFSSVVRRLGDAELSCEACNFFFPPTIRLTGEAAGRREAMSYVQEAFERLSALQTEIVVFGSAGARNMPDGFPQNRAWGQLAELLRGIGDLAGDYGITVAIEPLNRGESNIINTLEAAFSLAREVDHNGIRLLADYYHWRLEDESPDIITKVSGSIAHAHFAEVEGRRFPRESRDSYRVFFRHLLGAGYDVRMSVEAKTDSLERDAKAALRLFKELETGAK